MPTQDEQEQPRSHFHWLPGLRMGCIDDFVVRGRGTVYRLAVVVDDANRGHR